MGKGILFLAISTILFSCKDSNKESQDSTKAGKPVKGINIVANSPERDEYSFLSEYPYKTVPFIDSTNFDNIKTAKGLTVQQGDLLYLNKILGENYSDIIQSPQISYRVNLSDNFNTVVISYQLGEHELLSMLINYNADFMPMAWKEIAYDEIAEGLIRKQSEIYKDSILIRRISYFDEVPDTTYTRFKIEKNGSIVNADE